MFSEGSVQSCFLCLCFRECVFEFCYIDEFLYTVSIYRFVPSKSTVCLNARAVVCRAVNVKVGGKCLYVRHLPPTQYRDRPKFF